MIIAEVPKASYCSFFCFLSTIDECIINVWGYTEILPIIFILAHCIVFSGNNDSLINEKC